MSKSNTPAYVPVGEYLEKIKTCSPAAVFKNEPFDYLDIGSVDRDTKTVTGATKTKGVEAPSRARQVVQAGDVLVSTVRPNLNAVAQVGEEYHNAVASTGFCVLRPKAGVLHSNYLLHWAKSSAFINDMVARATGANYPAVSDKTVKTALIPLPSFEEQRRIAATLDTADALYRKDQELLRKYDALAHSIFSEMFGDPLQNPKKWPVRELGSFARNKSDLVDGPFGASVNVKVDYIEQGEIPVVRTKNVGLLSFKEDDLKFMTREKFMSVYRSNVQGNDLIITKVGTIGNVCEFPVHLGEGVLSTTGSCRLRVDEEAVNRKYLLYHLLYQRGYLNQIASEGVQPFLNMTHIKGIPIMCPPKSAQDKFASIVSNFEASKKLLLIQADYSFGLFSNLLQKSFA